MIRFASLPRPEPEKRGETRPVTSTPEISIGLPVYNGASAGLSETIDSILSQSFENFELVISDNASTDETRDMCADYARLDRRVRLHTNETNVGAGANHNLVFQLARGRFFKWAAADVQCLPGMLKQCYTVAADSRRSFSLVYPRCEMVDLTGEPLRDEDAAIVSSHPQPRRRMMQVIETVSRVNQLHGLMPRELLVKTRLMEPFAASDWVLLAELAMLGEIHEVPEVLLKRRIDPASGSGGHQSSKSWAVWLDTSLSEERFWLSPQQRLLYEYLRSAWRFAPTPTSKAAFVTSALYAWGKRKCVSKLTKARAGLTRRVGVRSRERGVPA